MSGTIGIYNTAELMAVQSRPETQPDGFWLRWFPTERLFSTEEIMFDDLGEEDRRLAPFVSPLAQGRVMREKGYITKSFKPAYLKPKHVVDPTKTIARRPGEPILGSLTPDQRRAAAIADRLISQRNMIERRLDWMACKAISDGKVTVSGEDYPTVEVDFGRHADLTNTLTSTARWSEVSTADPLADIAYMRTRSFELSGYPIVDLVFGTTAWGNFLKNTKVQNTLKADLRGGESNFNRDNITAGLPFEFQGVLSGPAGGGLLRMWTYANFYHDTLLGNRVPYINAVDVVGVGSPMGVQAFGAIMDMSMLNPARMWPKMWQNQDPSVEYVMTQSAPLMVPVVPNSTFRIRTSTP
jgi:hypothetical protein